MSTDTSSTVPFLDAAGTGVTHRRPAAKSTAARTRDASDGNTRNELGTLNGCFIPCLLNILGAVLYLRIGFSVGQMGMLTAAGIMAFSELVAYLTIGSFSAIVTNGRMKGGGAYYMISRNLGAAFGGSSGLLLWISYCTSVTFNTVAFTSTFMPTFFGSSAAQACDTGDGWLCVGCSSLTLFILFLVAYKGAGAFAKINAVIFAGLVVSLLGGIGSVFFKPEAMHLDAESYYPSSSSQSVLGAYLQRRGILPSLVGDDWDSSSDFCKNFNVSDPQTTNEMIARFRAGCHSGDFYPFSWGEADCTKYHQDARSLAQYPELAKECKYGVMYTLWPNTTVSDQCPDADGKDSMCSLSSVFAIIFPAVTGMMEGANLSGDLKDPGKSIPVGTLAAVSTAFLCYILLIVGQAGALSRTALQFNVRVLQFSCVSQYLIVLGVATACLSTALGSMFGSARILQAIARDDLIPVLRPFAKGTKQGDEPRRAVVLTYILAQAGLFIGSLSDVAPILTNFYLLAYSLTNLACYLLCVSNVINFRPEYKFFSWHSALIGAVLNVAVMLYLNVVYAVATLGVLGVLFLYIAVRGPDVQWGDIAQAMLFRYARNFMLKLQGRPESRKFWRPSLMLLSRAPEAQPSLVGCCNDMKRDGLFLLSCPLISAGVVPAAGTSKDDTEQSTEGVLRVRVIARRLRHLKRLIANAGLNAFPHMTATPRARLSCQNLMLSDGLGSMSASTVVVALLDPAAGRGAGAPRPEQSCGIGVEGAAEYVGILRDVLALEKNLLVAANFEDMDAQGTVGANQLPLSLSSRNLRITLDASASESDVEGSAAQGRMGNPWQLTFGEAGMGIFIDVWLLSPRWAWRSENEQRRDRQTNITDHQRALFDSNAGALSGAELDADLSLMLQFAYILQRARDDKYNKWWVRLRDQFAPESEDGAGEGVLPTHRRLRSGIGAGAKRGATSIRVMQILPRSADPHHQIKGAGPTSDDAKTHEKRLQASLKRARVPAQVHILYDDLEDTINDSRTLQSDCARMNEIIASHSTNSAVSFITLPLLPTENESTGSGAENFVSSLAQLTTGLPPTILVANGEGGSVVTTEI